MNEGQDTSKTLPWKDVIVRCFSKSFACDYDSSTLAFLHGNIDKEIELISSNNDKSSTISRTQALFEELITLYQHLRLKIAQETAYPNATLSCVRLLSQIIQIGLILTEGRVQSKWINRTLTAIRLFTGKQMMVYDALLLVNGLKKRYHKPYAIILKSVLIDSQNELEATHPLSYMEIILLFRRLHCLALKKYKNRYTTVVKRIKPPSNLISWLIALNVNGTAQHFKVTKYKTLASHFMKCLPEELIKKIRYIALSPYFFENEKIHCRLEVGEVTIEKNLFVIDSSAVSTTNDVGSNNNCKRKKSKRKKKMFKIPEIFQDSQWESGSSDGFDSDDNAVYDKSSVPTKKLKKNHEIFSTSNISLKNSAMEKDTTTEDVPKDKSRKLKSNKRRQHDDRLIADDGTATTSRMMPEKEPKPLSKKKQREDSLQCTSSGDTDSRSKVALRSKNMPKTKQVKKVCTSDAADGSKTEYFNSLSLKKKDVSPMPSPTKRSRISENLEVEHHSEDCNVQNDEGPKRICNDKSESGELESSRTKETANIDDEILRKVSKDLKDNRIILNKYTSRNSSLHSKSFETAVTETECCQKVPNSPQSKQNVSGLCPEKYQRTIESTNSHTNELDPFFLDYSGSHVTCEKAPNHEDELTLFRSENNDGINNALNKVNRLNEIPCEETSIEKDFQVRSVSSEKFDSAVTCTKELSSSATNTTVASPSKQTVLSNNLNLVEFGSKNPENKNQESGRSETRFDSDAMSHKKSDETESTTVDAALKDKTEISLNHSETPNDVNSPSGYETSEMIRKSKINDLFIQEESRNANLCETNAGNYAKNFNTLSSENSVSKIEIPHNVVENTSSQILFAPEEDDVNKNTSNIKSTLKDKKVEEVALFENNQSNKDSAENEINQIENKTVREESIHQNVTIALVDASVEAKICSCDGNEISMHENKDCHCDNLSNNVSEIQLSTKSQNIETFLADAKITSPEVEICSSNSNFSSLECDKSSVGSQIIHSELKNEKQMEISFENETEASNSDVCDSNTIEVSHIVNEISISGVHSNNETAQLGEILYVAVNINSENKIQQNEEMQRISENNDVPAIKPDASLEKEPVKIMTKTANENCDKRENDKLDNTIITDNPENSSKTDIQEQLQFHEENEIDASKENLLMKSTLESSEKKKDVIDDASLGENLHAAVNVSTETEIQKNEEMVIISEKNYCPAMKPDSNIEKEPARNMSETTNANCNAKENKNLHDAVIINSETKVLKIGEQIKIPDEKDGDTKKLEICIGNKCTVDTGEDSNSNTIFKNDLHVTTVEKEKEETVVNKSKTSHKNQDVILKVNEETIANETGNQKNEKQIQISEENSTTEKSKSHVGIFVANVIETSDTNQDLLGSSLNMSKNSEATNANVVIDDLSKNSEATNANVVIDDLSKNSEATNANVVIDDLNKNSEATNANVVIDDLSKNSEATNANVVIDDLSKNSEATNANVVIDDLSKNSEATNANVVIDDLSKNSEATNANVVINDLSKNSEATNANVVIDDLSKNSEATNANVVIDDLSKNSEATNANVVIDDLSKNSEAANANVVIDDLKIGKEMEVPKKGSSDTDKCVINANESSDENDLVSGDSKLGEKSPPTTIASCENKTGDCENSENVSLLPSTITDVQSQSEVVQSYNNPKPLLGATISELVFRYNNSLKKKEFHASEDNVKYEIFKKLKHVQNTDISALKLASNYSVSEYIPSFSEDKNFTSFSDISARDKDRRIDVDSGLKSPITCFSSAASTEIFSMHRKDILRDMDETDTGSLSRDEVSSNYQEQSDETKSQAFSSDQSEQGYDSKHTSGDEGENEKCETEEVQEIVHEPSKPGESFCPAENIVNPSVTNETNINNPENISTDTSQVANEDDTLGDVDTRTTEKAALPRKSLRLIDKEHLKTENISEEKTATNVPESVSSISHKKEIAEELLPNTTVTEDPSNQHPVESVDDDLDTSSISLASVPDPHTTPIKKNSRQQSKRVSALKIKQKGNLEKASSISKGYSLCHSKSSRRKDDSSNLDIDLNKLYLNSPSSSRSTRSSTRRESKFVKLLTSAIDSENAGDVTLTTKQESCSSIVKPEKEAMPTSYNLRNRKAMITPAKLKL